MISTNQSILKTVAHDMLLGLVQAIGDRPEDTAAQRESRSREVVHAVMAFEPRDPVEILFASLAVTHFHLILDSTRDALRGQAGMLKLRTKTGIVSLGRGLHGFLKEFRAARARPMQVEDTLCDTPPPPAAKPSTPNPPAAAPVERGNKTMAADRPAMLPPLTRTAASIGAMLAMTSPPLMPKMGTPAGPAAPVRRTGNDQGSGN